MEHSDSSGINQKVSWNLLTPGMWKANVFIIQTVQGGGGRKKQTLLWHIILLCDITIVMLDLWVFIALNGNEREYSRNLVTNMEQSSNILFMMLQSESQRQNIKLVSANSVSNSFQRNWTYPAETNMIVTHPLFSAAFCMRHTARAKAIFYTLFCHCLNTAYCVVTEGSRKLILL